MTLAKLVGDTSIYSILTKQYLIALDPLVFRFWGPLFVCLLSLVTSKYLASPVHVRALASILVIGLH